MAGRGGRRPGAGRKPKAVKRLIPESPIVAAEQTIRDRLPWLLDQLFALAAGVEVEERTAQGGVVVYTTPPDRVAITYLVDRVMGKPTQPIDVYDAATRLAVARGLDPARVISIYDGLKLRAV